MQHDLKRLLAYHTVENIGIIFIGLGLALAFRAFAMPSAAALAMTAGLLHVFNHSLFKSLLFFGAGAVLSATGERDMDHLGGLIHNMPRTAFAFLVGSAAISALPPFNGFVSEWLTFQAILLSPDLSSWVLKILAPAVGALLALSAALAAACFAKAFGITFLGRPAHGRGQARERDRPSHPRGDAGARGSLPHRRRLSRSFHRRSGARGDRRRRRQNAGADRQCLALDRPDRRKPQLVQRASRFSLHRHLGLAGRQRHPSLRLRRPAPGAAWDCGFPDPSPTTQYTAESFAQPIRRVFGTVAFVVRERVDMPGPGETRPARFDLRLDDRIWDTLYVPLVAAVGRASTQLNRLQFLTIRQYLGVVLGALVTLLVVLASWP